MRFVAHPDEAAGATGGCAWIVHRDQAGSLVGGPTPADLADAAGKHVADGGAARLWRRRLLRTLAARWLGVAAAEIVFARDSAGGARIAAPKPCFVSAASRGLWSAVAVGPAPLGVDLELADEEMALYALARGLGEEAALRRWTATEAYAKATGRQLDAAEAAIECLGGRPGRVPIGAPPILEICYEPFADGLAAAAFPPALTRA